MSGAARTSMIVEPECPVEDTHARAIVERQKTSNVCDVMCGHCERRLVCLTRRTRVPRFLDEGIGALDAQSHCRWCARPITPEAEAAAPLAGYVAFARRYATDRTCGHFSPVVMEAE